MSNGHTLLKLKKSIHNLVNPGEWKCLRTQRNELHNYIVKCRHDVADNFSNLEQSSWASAVLVLEDSFLLCWAHWLPARLLDSVVLFNGFVFVFKLHSPSQRALPLAWLMVRSLFHMAPQRPSHFVHGRSMA